MNEAHFHLMLTHGPIGGILFGTLLLLYALARKNELLIRVSMATFVVTFLLALSLYFTGEAAEEVIENLAHVSEAAIETHEEMAIWAIAASGLLGLLSLGGLIGYRNRIPTGLGYALLVGALVTGGLIGWTANQGGRISHPEVRSTPAPAPEEEGEEEEEASLLDWKRKEVAWQGGLAFLRPGVVSTRIDVASSGDRTALAD